MKYKLRELTSALIAHAGIPFPGAELAEVEVDTTRLENYLKKYEQAKAKRYGLYLYGPPGHGKSFILSGVCKALMRRRENVQWRHVSVLHTELCDFRNPNYQSQLENLSTVDVLVIDGLGSEEEKSVTSFYLSKLIQLFQTRSANGVLTMVTSSLDPKTSELATFYKTPAIADVARAATIQIPVSGINFRDRFEEQKDAFV